MEEQGNFVQFSPEAFLEEAIGIIQKAQDKRICLRILGALAVYIHCERCPQYRDFFFTLGRLGEGKPIFTDLDVMGYSRLRRASSWRERPVSSRTSTSTRCPGTPSRGTSSTARGDTMWTSSTPGSTSATPWSSVGSRGKVAWSLTSPPSPSPTSSWRNCKFTSSTRRI